MTRILRCAALAAAVAASPLRADVDLQVEPKAKVAGAILPAEEVETFRIHATEGATLTVALKLARGGDLEALLRMDDPSGEPFPIPAANLKQGSRKVTIRRLPIPETGLWAIHVVGLEGSGDYALSVKLQAARKAAATVEATGGVPALFPFSAPWGSRVSLRVKRGEGDYVPRFTSLGGAGYLADLTGLGRAGATSDAVTVDAVRGTGDLVAAVEDGGATTGPASLTFSASIRPARAPRRSHDVTPLATGKPHGGETVTGRAVDDQGGMVVVEDPDSDLFGAEITVAPGVLATPVTLTIASSPDLDIPDEEQTQPSGPSVVLGPAGMEFTEPVLVTIPYDPDVLPEGADPQDIVFLHEHSDGTVEPLVPVAVDEDAHLATVEVDSFSGVVTTVARGTPPVHGPYWFVSLRQAMLQDADGADSRAREYGVRTGVLAFDRGGTFTGSAGGTLVKQDNASPVVPTSIDGDVEVVKQNTAAEAGTWSYRAGKQRVSVATLGKPAEARTFLLARDASVLVGVGDDPAKGGARLDLLVRRHKGPLTLRGLAGRYAVFLAGVGARVAAVGGGETAVPLRYRGAGAMTLDERGVARLDLDEIESDFDFAAGAYVEEGGRFRAAGQAAIDGDGSVRVVFATPDGDVPVRLLPGRDGDLLVGTTESDDALPLLVLAVRTGGDGAAEDAEGAYLLASLAPGSASYPTPSGSVPDLDLGATDVAALLGPGGALTGAGTRSTVARTAVEPGGVASAAAAVELSLSLALGKDGTFGAKPSADTPALRGAFSAGAHFGVFLSDPRTGGDDWTVGVLLRPPPEK